MGERLLGVLRKRDDAGNSLLLEISVVSVNVVMAVPAKDLEAHMRMSSPSPLAALRKASNALKERVKSLSSLPGMMVRSGRS
jgi:hypothetical protein